jgi:hypothetical protein
MSISAVNAVSAPPPQTVRPVDHDKDDKAAAATVAKVNDGDRDDRSAVSTAVTRSSASVQQALSTLKAGG